MNKYATDFRNSVQVQKNSDEYRRILYQLKLSLRINNAEIKVL